VWEDVCYGPLNLGLGHEEARAAAERALGQVGIGHIRDKAPYHLSAGEKRRVALAGVLAMQPEILVLDEPTTFLDPPGRRALVQVLRALPQAKLIVTHDVWFARALATRAVFFQRGRILREGFLEEVLAHFAWDLYASKHQVVPALPDGRQD